MDRNNMRNQNSMPSGLPGGMPSGMPSGLPSGLPTGMPTGMPPKRPSMPYLAQHDELIRYIHDAWHKITEQRQHGNATFYRHPQEQTLTNFQPFDLEKYWGHRAVQNYHISRGHQ